MSDEQDFQIMNTRMRWLLLFALWLPGAQGAELLGGEFSHLLDEEPAFLKVDQAFVLDATLAEDGSLLANWTIADGYYLYRHQFGFDSRPDGAVALSEFEIGPGKIKVDEYFGEVEVYYHDARVRVPLRSTADPAEPFEVGVSYQGCADRGLCYPPETRWIRFAGVPGLVAGDDSGPGKGGTSSVAVVTQERSLADLLSQGTLFGALLLFFIGGVGLAFTPCVLPMVPILSSIIVGESDSLTRTRAFTLSLSYVLGMAVTYAVLGVMVGLFGASMNLQAALQSPPVLIGFAAVFVALSLSMFGFYELQMPQGLQNRLNALSTHRQGGKHLSVVLMGAISSLVVSPCVSAPLAGALIYISSTGDSLLGGGALLALGLGMGLPLLIIGSSGGHLLPRAGVWMDNVKAVFGVLLLAVAIWLLERVLPGPATLMLWAALAMGSGVYLGALDFSARQGWGQLWKATGAFGFIYGVVLLVGAAGGAEDPLRPLHGFGIAGPAGAQVETLEWRPVKGLDGLQAELQAAGAAGQIAMLDLYADWCISCKVMERSVFPADGVRQRLSGLRLLRADVTANDKLDKALLAEYGLFGPPSMIFFAQDGSEIDEFRVMGELDRKAMEAHLVLLSQWESRNNFGETATNFGELADN
jgi:thiol:disulfide interchange protein DsbD